MTTPLERIGRITNSPDVGQFVLVCDDRERTGGFLIFQSSAPDIFSAPKVFDSWVVRRDDLDTFFSEASWDVEWQLQPVAD